MILTPSQETRFTTIFSNLGMEERGKFLRLYEKISTRANAEYLYSSHIKNLKSHEVISIKKGMNVNSKNQELHDFLDELIEAQPQLINQPIQENSSINVPNRKDAEFRIVDCINEFSAQAEILPIEFDRFFYLENI